MILHVRRRRYKDADGRSIILNHYPLKSDGTELSVEFGVLSLTVSISYNAFVRHSTRCGSGSSAFSWYKEVADCTIREIKSARDCIKAKEEEVLNYFINRHTNASAESFNSKIKGFKAQLHGVADIPFFMYRLCTIFG